MSTTIKYLTDYDSTKHRAVMLGLFLAGTILACWLILDRSDWEGPMRFAVFLTSLQGAIILTPCLVLIGLIPKTIRKLRLFQKSGLAKTGSVITILVIYIPWICFLLLGSIGVDVHLQHLDKFIYMSLLFTFLVYLLFLCFLDIKKLFVNTDSSSENTAGDK